MSNKPLRVFIGCDPRQPVSYHTLAHSIMTTSKKPVSITPLCIEQLPIERVGLTPFTFSRFLVPWLCDYEGWALFLDADILLNHDISELFDLANDEYAVMVSKNEKRFEWASVVLFNCAKCKELTPEFIEKAEKLHTFEWLHEDFVGSLPPEWNHLVGYDKPNINAKLIHYTQGVPGFDELEVCEHASLWHKARHGVNHIAAWTEVMGNSVHAVQLDGGLRIPKMFVNFETKSIKDEFKESLRRIIEKRHKANLNAE